MFDIVTHRILPRRLTAPTHHFLRPFLLLFVTTNDLSPKLRELPKSIFTK